jgi:thioredoxin 1
MERVHRQRALTGTTMDAVTDSSFKNDVLDAPGAVLVDFWAPWCGPCRAVTPVLEALSGELAGRLKIVKVNVDENQQVAGALGVRSIPTLVLFKDGKPVQGAVGALSRAEITQLVSPHLPVAASPLPT